MSRSTAPNDAVDRGPPPGPFGTPRPPKRTFGPAAGGGRWPTVVSVTEQRCPADHVDLHQAPRARYFDLWDLGHDSAWRCHRCGRLYSEDRYGELVQVWPDRVKRVTSQSAIRFTCRAGPQARPAPVPTPGADERATTERAATEQAR